MSERHTVLVVDDEQDVIDGLRRTLLSQNYRFLSATSAAEALAILEREPVDVLVSDVDMPGMNGIELVSRVRRSHPEVVRMLLTGGASLGSAMRAINDGEVYRYLTKPWDTDELRATIRQAIDRLAELRRAATADHQAAAREQLLVELEREHPGIRAVPGAGAVRVLEGARLARLAEAMVLRVAGGRPLADTWSSAEAGATVSLGPPSPRKSGA